MLYNKRGDLTTKQIVILIILILSFIVILFLIFRLNLGGETKKEICHNSVVLRGKSLFPSAVPLDCHTEYICLSKTKNCDKLDKPDEVIIVKTPNDVYKTIADKMADCWSMFGEGAINYIGSEMVPDFYCSICSQIYFDSSVKEIFGGETFSQRGIYDYIVNTEIPGKKIQYDKYLYGLDFSSSEQILELFKSKNVNNMEFMNINMNNPQIILMGMTDDVSTLGWILGAGVVVSVAATAVVVTIVTAGSASPAIIAVVGALLAKSTALVFIGGLLGGGLFGGIVSQGISGLEYMRPIIIEKASKSFEAIKCEHIVTFS